MFPRQPLSELVLQLWQAIRCHVTGKTKAGHSVKQTLHAAADPWQWLLFIWQRNCPSTSGQRLAFVVESETSGDRP